MFTEIIELIEIDMNARTEMGGREPRVIKRTEIFADKQSVRRNEFYQAMQTGFETNAVFKTWLHEYNEERVLLHNEKYYSILRSYEDGSFIYLTCHKRKGLFDESIR